MWVDASKGTAVVPVLKVIVHRRNHIATSKGWALPDSYEGYAFLSYECKPLPTNHLTAAEVLKFRDDAWHTYFSNPVYLSLVEQKFGDQQRRNVEEMCKIRLKRQLLGE